MELRSRSRSRSETPQLILREPSENPYDLRRSSRERSNTPVDLPSGRRSSRIGIQGKKLVDKNMDTIAEQKEETPKRNMNEVTEKSTVKKIERRSERQKVKTNIFTPVKSDSVNRKSTKNEDISLKTVTSDYSSEDATDKENGSNKPKTAYEIYKQAGDWWDVFPKTDYTYSESSQCRYEIAPGILAMPNMSRRSIHSNENSSFDLSNLSTSQLNNTSHSFKESTQNWLNTKSSNNEDIISINGVPQVVPHIRNMQDKNIFHREIYYERTEFRKSVYNNNNETLQSSNFSRLLSYLNPLSQKANIRQRSFDSQADSDTETTAYKHVRDLKFRKKSSWYQKILIIILSSLYYILNMLKSIWSCTSNYVYLLFAHVILLDSWFLSRISSFRDSIANRRRKILFLAILIPLLWTGLKQSTAKSVETLQLIHTINSTHDPSIELLLRRVQVLEDTSAKQYQQVQELLLKLTTDCVTSEELNRVKLDFKSIKELYEQSNLLNKKSQITLTPEEIDIQMNAMLQGYVTKEEWSKILMTLATKENLVATYNQKDISENCNDCTSESVNVRSIVRDILKIYDADKTGRVDYALESAGGQVISTRCTQRYDLKTRAFKVLGWTLFYESNNPRTVIQGHPMQPGLCWAFQDFPGYLLIKTRSLIYVTGFTLEHVPKSILPNGDMRSAPRKFNVWGLKDENDPNPVMFGEYTFENSDESLQYFAVQNSSISEPYHYVELQIHSNYGRLEYTCLYRFRIHGTLA